MYISLFFLVTQPQSYLSLQESQRQAEENGEFLDAERGTMLEAMHEADTSIRTTKLELSRYETMLEDKDEQYEQLKVDMTSLR